MLPDSEPTSGLAPHPVPATVPGSPDQGLAFCRVAEKQSLSTTSEAKAHLFKKRQ